jgi:hypothetical protein
MADGKPKQFSDPKSQEIFAEDPVSVRDILKLTANPRANFVPKIMIRCPITGKSVPTGLTTETIVFDSIAGDLTITMSCPACRKVHEWRPKGAWIDKGKSGSHTRG